jgi:hypothetical protein
LDREIYIDSLILKKEGIKDENMGKITKFYEKYNLNIL